MREVDTSNREFPNRSALGLYPKGGVGALPLGSAFPGTPRDSENLAPDAHHLSISPDGAEAIEGG